jgi:hypothetical protein
MNVAALTGQQPMAATFSDVPSQVSVARSEGFD